MLEVEGLVAGYGGTPMLRDVSMRLAAGELVGLLGANNAGKTTLINCLSGIVQPMSGRILFEGKDITRATARERVELGIIQVPEGRLVFPEMSIRENLLLGGFCDRARPHRPAQMDKVLELFPRLKERLTQAAGTLSGGEQQMLAIGRALMTNPMLLILDEATEGLAPLIREEIWSCLSMLKGQGQSVLVIDKNVGNLARIADRHYMIERGRTVWSGTSEQLLAEPELQHRYLGI